MKKLLTFTVLFIVCNALFGQVGNINGRVLDELNLPLTGAYVSVEENITTTDINGYFTLQGVPEGVVKISITFNAFFSERSG